MFNFKKKNTNTTNELLMEISRDIKNFKMQISEEIKDFKIDFNNDCKLLSEQFVDMQNNLVEHELKLENHEERITVLEKKVDK